MSERRWLAGLAELIDRLTITQQKEIFITDHSAEYRQERSDLMHDIDMLLQGVTVDAAFIHAVVMIALSNRVIWENESKARAGGDGQDKHLKFTHSINGVRNRFKNVIAAAVDGRQDFKLDCLAAELPPEFGSWDIK